MLLLACAASGFWGLPSSPAWAQSPELQQQFPWFFKPARPAKYPEILVDGGWLSRRLASREAVPVDVRPPSRYAAGHLPGAVRFEIPSDPSLSRPVRELLAKAGLQGGETLVLYGSDGDRPVIGEAFLALAGAGWANVRVLAPTYEQWAGSGLPVETAPGRRPARRPSASPETGRVFVIEEELRSRFGRPGFEVLDLRGGWAEDYGAPAPFAAGHVPHALPFNVESLLPAAGWPAPDKIRETLGALGPRPSDHVDLDATFLLYGEGPQDPRLGLGFLLLRMAGVSARVFAAGFPAWAGEPRNPVVRLLDALELETLLARDQRTDGGGEAPRLEDRLPRSFILLDLREDWDYDEEHIPGAYSLPERQFSERFATVLRSRWPDADPRTTPLVFYCYGRACKRSRNCATWAAQKGFAKLLWFREGMEGWSGIGGPVFKTPTGGAASASPRRARPAGPP